MEMDKITENIRLSSGKYKVERDYWQQKLSGNFSMSCFPAKPKQEGVQSPERGVLNFQFPENIARRLETVSNGSEYGAYILLLCSVKYLLYRYTGDDDLAVGMPGFKEAGTDEGDLQALRTCLGEDWTFRQFLQDVKQTTDEARKYRNLTLKMMIKLLDLKSEDEDFFEFKTVVLLKNIHHTPEEALSRAGMVFSFNLATGAIDLDISYNKSLYDDDFVRRLSGHLVNFFTQVFDNSDLRLDDIRILGEGELRQLLEDFNDTAAEYSRHKLVHQLVEEQVKREPEGIALVSGQETLTYDQLNKKANRLAGRLREKGVKADTVVGIMPERSFDMLVGILGILKAGGAYLPLDPAYPAERIKYMLADSNAFLLLTNNRFAHHVNFEKGVLFLDDDDLYAAGDANPDVGGNPSELAYVVYTSGSTGNPKGAMIEHGSVVNFIKGITDLIDFKSGDTVLALTTLSFDIFVLETLLPLTRGLKVVIASEAEQKDPRLLNKLILENEVDLLQLTPSRLQLLIDYKEIFNCLEKVKTILVGGEVFPRVLLDTLQQLTGARIYNMYGPIETTIWSTVKEIRPDNELNIGKPIANTRVYILGKNNRLQFTGLQGELCIAGAGLARGYIGNPELTAEKFIPNPFPAAGKAQSPMDRLYRTGDLARWLPDGNIEFIGRQDHQVKIQGVRIEMGEIEVQLLRHEDVKEAVVIDKEDEDGHIYLVAYVVFNEDVFFDVMELKDYLLKYLPVYMVPAYYVKLDKMPFTHNGKIDRMYLRRSDESLNLKAPYAAPTNDLERKIVNIWQEILNIEKIGIDDDIEALGGNSFLAMRLELAMEMEDLEITNIEIFQNRTVRKLSEYIEKKQKEEQENMNENI